MHTTLTSKQFRTISTIAEQRWGLHLPEAKSTLVAGRMSKLARRTGAGSIDELIARLNDTATDEDMLEFFDALATNTTSFFREKQHFDFLARELYPTIERSGQRRIRIWSAASSIGAEPYTLAVHMHEHIPDLASYDAKILATDLSSKAVTRSKEGAYTEKELEGMPKALRFKYFDKTGDGRMSVKPMLRDMVSVHRLNLLDPWPMRGPFDAIFLRNVMIYFDAHVREKLVNRMAELLAPHGVLVIGSAETLAGLNTPYQTVQPAVYRPGGDTR
ncbi:MAG: protein-glutamate O-methyltransferase CheR [Phycisphaerales bacterium]